MLTILRHSRFLASSMFVAVALLVEGCSSCQTIGCVPLLTVEAPSGLVADTKICVQATCVELVSAHSGLGGSVPFDD